MMKFSVVAVVTCVMLVVGFGYETNSGTISQKINATINSNSTLAARYPLRSRTPDFFGRSMGRPSSMGRYRA